MLKRFIVLSAGLLLVVLSACAPPQIQIQDNVKPTLFSAQPTADGTIVLQGRYFSDGLGGQREDSYVVLGANVHQQGGVVVRATEWSDSRVVAPIPEGASSGFVFVVVRGQFSNGLTANLP